MNYATLHYAHVYGWLGQVVAQGKIPSFHYSMIIELLFCKDARHQTSYSQSQYEDFQDFHPWPRLCEIHEFLNAQQIMQGRLDKV